MKNGAIVPESFVKMAKDLYGDDNEKAISIAEEIGNECANITYDDRCEFAVLLMECAKMIVEQHTSSLDDEETK